MSKAKQPVEVVENGFNFCISTRSKCPYPDERWSVPTNKVLPNEPFSRGLLKDKPPVPQFKIKRTVPKLSQDFYPVLWLHYLVYPRQWRGCTWLQVHTIDSTPRSST